ncbi:hypothetical protein C4B63_485g4 [Trypanosoma cruzi]|uniref:Uncharacterized protein n=1 Tax=Trypanosoma cruzi TaxID=5693 RepID=A0A2V2UJE6_TRYCR|nr:hypothetical protein C4B63_485g4 [Trypanosoma cruzi]
MEPIQFSVTRRLSTPQRWRCETTTSSTEADYRMVVLHYVTLIILPLTIVASQWGMNCYVPWKDLDSTTPFWTNNRASPSCTLLCSFHIPYIITLPEGQTSLSKPKHILIYAYVYKHVCICMCVCVADRWRREQQAATPTRSVHKTPFLNRKLHMKRKVRKKKKGIRWYLRGCHARHI